MPFSCYWPKASMWLNSIGACMVLILLGVIVAQPQLSDLLVVCLSVASLIVAILLLLFTFLIFRLLYAYAAFLTWSSYNYLGCAFAITITLAMHVSVFKNLSAESIFLNASGEILANSVLIFNLLGPISRRFHGVKRKLNGADMECLMQVGKSLGFTIKKGLL